MNKEQRERLSQILDALNTALNDIDEIKCEEEEKYDNLPENFQDGEKGEAIQDGISSLEDAYSYLDDAISSLNDLV